MTGKMFKMCAIGVAVVGLINLNCHGITYRTVALSDDFVPGIQGLQFGRIDNPVINADGQVAFSVSFINNGVFEADNRGIWVENSGVFRLVARSGDTAPSTETGSVYNNIFNPLINDAGQVAFLSSLSGPGIDFTNDFGIWSEGTGTSSLVAREGDAIPGSATNETYFRLETVPSFGLSGQTSFVGRLFDPVLGQANINGLWLEEAGAVTQLARAGDTVSGRGIDYTFTGFSTPRINSSGQLAFYALAGSIQNAPASESIWFANHGSLTPIAVVGDQAPGTSAGTVFGSPVPVFIISLPSLNDAGQVVFSSSLIGADVNASNSSGIWSYGTGALGLVIRSGTPAPGTDASFDTFNLIRPLINSVGQIAFQGTLTGTDVSDTNNSGIWLHSDGNINAIVREGQQAPGDESDLFFGDFADLTMNGAGQVAFLSSVLRSGSTSLEGIWATDRNGSLTLVALEGDTFNVNSDPLIEDLRTIKHVGMLTGSGGEDGLPTSFNDNGQLTFKLIFDDGTSGIFVAAIPEPTSLMVFVVGSAVALCSRHRRPAS